MNPFKYVSKTYAGGLVALLGYLAIQLGITSAGEWSELVAVIVQGVGIVAVIVDRVSKKDISVLGWRKR